MSKVKHLLRKLHIGDHHHHGRPPSALDPSPQTTPSQPSTSSSPPSDLSQTTLASESESLSNSNFNFFEEEFQMQLALAISVSDQGQNCVDPETAQINAAKQISLGCTPSHNVSEFLSLRYWSCNVVNYDEKVVDGFYDVCGIDSNLVVQAKMPSLVELGAISALDDVGREVVLVNRAVDMDLRHLEERVYYMSLELHALDKTLNTTFLVQKIADLIVERMGGPVRDVEEMFRRWRARNRELRIYLNTIILPLGSLDIGHSRQRALLFKVLADRINLPCKLVKGSYYTGTDEGAVNLIKLDDGSEYIIDLMGAPGTLIPAEVPGGHHQNFRSYLPIVDEAPKTKNPSSESSANATESNREGRRVAGNIQKELLKDDVGNQTEFTREPMSMCSEKCASISKELFPNINSHDSREELLKGNGLVRRDGFVDQCHAEIYLSKNEQSLVPYTGFQCNSSIKHSAEGNQSSLSIQGDQSVHLKDSNDDTISNNDVTVHRELVDFSDQSNSNKIHNVQIDPVLNGVAEILWEDLQIGERIGIGSYGEVYRAEWNGTEVAVKKFMNQDISGDALAQFKCEIEIMLRLRHPNVVLFMGAVTRPPNMSILTEFLPRGSLYRLLHRPNIHIDEKRRIKMALDVAKGMNYLHTSHPIIVHRDLKTPNLLVDKNWVVKVCDFGMSRLQHHTYLSSKSAAGTAEWMAPEVLRNEPSNEKSDVYSFGVILWELATLRVPWTEMNSMQVVGAVGFQGRNLEIPPTVDPLVAEIISDCWIRNPNERPSFKQIISRLKCLQRLNVQGSDNRVNLK